MIPIQCEATLETMRLSEELHQSGMTAPGVSDTCWGHVNLLVITIGRSLCTPLKVVLRIAQQVAHNFPPLYLVTAKKVMIFGVVLYGYVLPRPTCQPLMVTTSWSQLVVTAEATVTPGFGAHVRHGCEPRELQE